MSKFLINFLLIIGMSLGLVANELEYQDNASVVISNSLKAQKNNHPFLQKLYKQVLYVPIWMGEKSLTKQAKELFNYIEQDKTLNQSGKLYNDAKSLYQKAQEVYDNNGSLAQKVSMEFKISQIYKGYTNYLYFGSINWGAFKARISNLMINDVHTDWVLHRPEVNQYKIAENALFGIGLKKQLDSNIPTQYHYKALLKELQKYIDIKNQGGWSSVTLKSKLKPHHKDIGVLSLRDRLIATNDYQGTSSDDIVYDDALIKAVKNFQARHGLIADGVIGRSTLKALNESVDSKITKIRLNLDRIKWLSKRADKHHIIINIPDFKLYFEENNTVIKSMRVITGKPNHPTPIFGDEVELIVLNPYWNVPTSIIQKEMIPKLLRNPKALKRRNIEIFSGWGKNAKKINPEKVDWRQYLYSNRVPYRFAQLPGYRNALGKIKFLFPNKFSVYMHDTPTKSLFRRYKRAFSHGCIRLSQPRELLKTFASIDKSINLKKAFKILKGNNNTTLKLSKKVPVDIIYLTAYVDYNGKLQFRDDIYGYDKMQLKSFREW
jgi:murein L,D-transpeptidase YcbB/YkuD